MIKDPKSHNFDFIDPGSLAARQMSSLCARKRPQMQIAAIFT
jgi:hypothetical protein